MILYFVEYKILNLTTSSSKIILILKDVLEELLLAAAGLANSHNILYKP